MVTRKTEPMDVGHSFFSNSEIPAKKTSNIRAKLMKVNTLEKKMKNTFAVMIDTKENMFKIN